MAHDERVYPDPDNGIFASHLYRYVWVLPAAFNRVVLDAGCGSGYGANLLATIAAGVVAVDYDGEVIARNKLLYGHRPNVEFDVMDVCALRFPDETFDLVVSFEVFEHLERRSADDFVAHLHRVCRPGGTVVLSTPNRLVEKPHLRSAGVEYDYHVNSVSPAELRRVLRQHFRSVTLFGQRPRETALKRTLRALDPLNLRHHLLSYGAKIRLDVVLSGGAPSHGADLAGIEIQRSLVRQSGNVVAVCRK